MRSDKGMWVVHFLWGKKSPEEKNQRRLPTVEWTWGEGVGVDKGSYFGMGLSQKGLRFMGSKLHLIKLRVPCRKKVR